MPFRSDLACRDFRIHRGKPADNWRSPSNIALLFGVFNEEHNVLFYAS
jgi:hypothetical protein